MAKRLPAPVSTYTSLLKTAGWKPRSLRLVREFQLQLGPEGGFVPGWLLGLHQNRKMEAALVVLDEVEFPSGAALYQRYVDMAAETRLCLRAVKDYAPAPYAIVASPFECFLYDTRSEELLISASSPEESAGNIFPRLTPEDFETGTLDRIARRSPVQWGRDLADWLRVWAAKLGQAAGHSPDTLRALQGHWLLAWKDMLDRKDDDPVAEEEEPEDGLLMLESAPASPAGFYSEFVEPVSRRFPLGLFRAYEDGERKFWGDKAAAYQLSQFLLEAQLLSRSKFRVDNALYAFTGEETENKSWKAALTQKEEVGKRLERHDLTIYDPVTVDVGESGFGWMLTLLESLTRYWIEENLRRKEALKREGSLSLQLDLFAQEPSGLHRQGYLDDILLFTLTHSYRVKTSSVEERFLAGLLIAMKAMELAEAYSLPLTQFDKIDSIFEI